MSSDIEAELEVSINADKFTSGSDKVQKGFNEIDKSASNSADNVGDSLNDMGNEATKAGNEIKKAGEKGEKAMDDMGDAAEETGRDMTAVGVGIFGLGQAIGGLSDTIFGFNEKLIALEKSAFGVEETTRDLIRASEDLKTAMDDGTLVGRELTRAIEDLDFIYRKLAIEEKEVIAEQEALNSEFINFGLTLTQTVSFGIFTVSALLSTQQKAMIALRVQTLLLSKTFGILIFNTNKFKIAMIGATLSLKGLAIGMKAVVASMGPIGIALTVGITLWALWESNVGGVQERMAELWELIKQFIPALQLLESAVSSIFPQEAHAQVQEYGSSIEQLTEQLAAGKITADEFATQIELLDGAIETAGTKTDEFGNVIQTAGDNMGTFIGAVGSTATTLSGFSGQLDKTASSITTFYDLAGGKGLDDLKQRTDLLTSAFQFMKNEGIDPLSPAMKQARASMLPEIKSIGAGINTAFGTEGIKDFINEMQRMGAITIEEGKKMRKEFGLIKDAQEDLKKNLNSEIDPNTGEPKTVTRKKANVTREFMNSLPPELRGNFRVSNGPGEVNSASLQKQRAAQAIVNAERRKTRDKFRQIREAVSILAFLKPFGIDLPGATQSRRALFAKVRKSRLEFQKRFGPFGFSVRDIKRLNPADVFAAVQLQKDQRVQSNDLAAKNNLDADEIFNERKSFGGSVFQATRFVNRNTFFQKQSAALGLTSTSIEDALRGPNAQRISNTFSNMLAFLNQERHVVVRT